MAAIHSDSAPPVVARCRRRYSMRSSPMLTRLFRRCAHLGRSLARALRQRLVAAAKPAEQAVVAGARTDLVRGRPALVAENAFLRQQLVILRRGVKRRSEEHTSELQSQ